MKKIISVALIVAMCATMMLVPTVANAKLNISLNMGNGTANGGLYGRADNEYAVGMEASGEKAMFPVGGSSYDFTDENYAVLDLNVAPNEKTTYISVGPNAGFFTVQSDKFNVNRWNHVRIFVENKTEAEITSSGQGQKYTMYINGVKVGEGAQTTYGNIGHYYKGFRFNLMTDSSNSGSVVGYVADVELSDSKEITAPVMPVVASGEKFTVTADKTITFAAGAGVTVKDIKDANPEADIRVYSNNEFKSQINDSDTLTEGNILVVKKDNIYDYYTFTEVPEKYDLVTSTPNLDSNGGKTEVVSGEVFGRTSSELKKVTIGKGDNFHDVYWKSPQPASRYVVYSVDVAPTGDITHIYFGTNGHARMSLDAKVGQYLNAGKWNNIKFVYDIINNTSDLHVNNVCISTGYPTKYVMGSTNIIRFIINGATNSYAYIDNLRVYELTSAEKPVNADNAIVHSIVDFEQFGGWSKATASQTEGPDGGDDTAAMIKANNDSGDGVDVYTELFWDSNLYGSEKYVVYQADVRFGANASKFQIGSKGHERISDIISASNPKLKDDWNRITVVSEADTGINKTYINGIYDHTYESAIHRVKYDNKYNTIRIIAYAKDKTDTKTEVISLDNVLVFRTNIEQVYGAPVTGSYSAEVGATFTADCGYGTLLVAAYNDDNMIEAKYINVTADNKTLTLKSEGATEYRAFIWNNINAIKPMYDFIPVTPTN